MIYVISPFLSDAVKACQKEGFDCPIKAGRLLNKNIYWVYDWQQLMGKKIFKVDKIIYGDLTCRFDVETLNKINMEIELRKSQ